MPWSIQSVRSLKQSVKVYALLATLQTVVCCIDVEDFSSYCKVKNLCQGLNRSLGGFDCSAGFPPGFSGAGQEGTSQELWVVAEIFEQPGLPSEPSLSRGGRSPEDAHLSISSPREEREGIPNLNYSISAKYKNIGLLTPVPGFASHIFHKVISLKSNPV